MDRSTPETIISYLAILSILGMMATLATSSLGLGLWIALTPTALGAGVAWTKWQEERQAHITLHRFGWGVGAFVIAIVAAWLLKVLYSRALLAGLFVVLLGLFLGALFISLEWLPTYHPDRNYWLGVSLVFLLALICIVLAAL